MPRCGAGGEQGEPVVLDRRGAVGGGGNRPQRAGWRVSLPLAPATVGGLKPSRRGRPVLEEDAAREAGRVRLESSSQFPITKADVARIG